jgi:hypothetical protein
VAGSCEYGDEPSDSGATELVHTTYRLALEAVLGIGNIGFCLGPRAFRGLTQT